ncbi:MAG: hypothetical protein QM680_11540 [Luteolibacter sp.]
MRTQRMDDFQRTRRDAGRNDRADVQADPAARLAVGFTGAILDHWKDEQKPAQEIRRRLMELDDAQGAVKQPQEVWEIPTKLGPQRAYLRKYKASGKQPERWMAVFVPSGTGRTYFSSGSPTQADNSFRKGTLIRFR